MKRWAFAMVLLAGGCGSAGQAPPPPEREAPGDQDLAAAQALFDEYAKRFTQGAPLMGGDTLRFVVVGHPQLSFEALVPVEGSIEFPSIGKLVLAGRTLSEVGAELKRRLGDGYLVNPDVTVHAAGYVRRCVYVLGAVQKAGDYELPGGRPITLVQAMTLAMGFKEDADKRRVLVMRPKPGSGERLMLPVDFVALTRENQGKDLMLLPEDVVFVGTRDRIYVFGQVIKAGAYLLHAEERTTITQAISMAGGFTRIAKESSIRLNRRLKNGQVASYVIDVGRILDGHPGEDVELAPGDVIFVPESFF